MNHKIPTKTSTLSNDEFSIGYKSLKILFIFIFKKI